MIFLSLLKFINSNQSSLLRSIVSSFFEKGTFVLSFPSQTNEQALSFSELETLEREKTSSCKLPNQPNWLSLCGPFMVCSGLYEFISPS